MSAFKFFNVHSMTLFSDPGTWRETSQWKAVFATPSIDESNTQLFANFGSISEDFETISDNDTIVRNVTEQLAMDVFQALKNDFTAQPRSAQTSQGGREPARRGKTPGPSRTPVVTPSNSRRFGNPNAPKNRLFTPF